ncbi:hypothetical protein [Fodinicola feengrottensis]|uniref:DUF4760 domain-containing protein n=1 Tax=Fodinicola feengrottensis TaxID=435914 RepID=A0ABP4VBQ8_9ACTN|nr:hypothetical protein [Fodinicola feengrottensis]
MDWTAVIPPVVGAFLNGVISTLVALVVLYKTRKSNFTLTTMSIENSRQLATAQAAIKAGEDLDDALFDLVERLNVEDRQKTKEWVTEMNHAWNEFTKIRRRVLPAIRDNDLQSFVLRVTDACLPYLPRSSHPFDRARVLRNTNAVATTLGSVSQGVHDWRSEDVLIRDVPETLIATLKTQAVLRPSRLGHPNETA